MRDLDISDLAGIWFHDVKVVEISLDYVKREAKFECVIPVGFWNSPNRYGIFHGVIHGTLILMGLLYIVVEPPDKNYSFEDSQGIEITSEGSVTEEKFATQLASLPQDLPDDAFLHYFFVSEWNSFIFVAATEAKFQVE
ncbi:MAG: hypothetical protein OHK0029_36010 [Armatimonadaceae bacterium]